MEAAIHCIARLLKRQHANVGVFYSKEPEHRLPQQEIFFAFQILLERGAQRDCCVVVHSPSILLSACLGAVNLFAAHNAYGAT
jgi:hypothetical protein